MAMTSPRTAAYPLGRRVGRCVLLAASLWALAGPAQAALFGDDEARRAILELRSRVDANRQASEDAQRQQAEQLKTLSEEGGAQTRRALLDLASQLDVLRRELADLRGQNENLARDVAELQRKQRDATGALDERLRSIEPVKISLEGQEFVARPEETAAYEAAMATLRAADFAKAAQQYAQFLTRYPDSGYVPVVLYWQGNALYASRSYKPAIASYQRLLDKLPNHVRSPEALLAIANCHLELKDARSTKATLQKVVSTYPNSEAASAAKDRLDRLR